MVAFKAWKDIPEKVFGAPFAGGSISRGDLARAARRRLHHRPAHRLDHVRRRRARVPGAHPGDQVLRRSALPAPLAPGTMLDRGDGRRTRSAAPTSSTSAPARSRRAASSAWRARCRRSGTACAAASPICGGARGEARSRIRARTDRDLSMKVRASAESSRSLIAHHARAATASAMNLLGALLIVALRLPLRHRLARG